MPMALKFLQDLRLSECVEKHAVSIVESINFAFLDCDKPAGLTQEIISGWQVYIVVWKDYLKLL